MECVEGIMGGVEHRHLTAYTGLELRRVYEDNLVALNKNQFCFIVVVFVVRLLLSRPIPLPPKNISLPLSLFLTFF